MADGNLLSDALGQGYQQALASSPFTQALDSLKGAAVNPVSYQNSMGGKFVTPSAGSMLGQGLALGVLKQLGTQLALGDAQDTARRQGRAAQDYIGAMPNPFTGDPGSPDKIAQIKQSGDLPPLWEGAVAGQLGQAINTRLMGANGMLAAKAMVEGLGLPSDNPLVQKQEQLIAMSPTGASGDITKMMLQNPDLQKLIAAKKAEGTDAGKAKFAENIGGIPEQASAAADKATAEWSANPAVQSAQQINQILAQAQTLVGKDSPNRLNPAAQATVADLYQKAQNLLSKRMSNTPGALPIDWASTLQDKVTAQGQGPIQTATQLDNALTSLQGQKSALDDQLGDTWRTLASQAVSKGPQAAAALGFTDIPQKDQAEFGMLKQLGRFHAAHPDATPADFNEIQSQMQKELSGKSPATQAMISLWQKQNKTTQPPPLGATVPVTIPHPSDPTKKLNFSAPISIGFGLKNSTDLGSALSDYAVNNGLVK